MPDIRLAILNSCKKNNLQLILLIKKLKLPYSLHIICEDKDVLNSSHINHYDIEDTINVINDNDIIINFNPSIDDYINTIYCIENNKIMLNCSKYIKFKSNGIFKDFDDLLNILTNLSLENYKKDLLIDNKDEYIMNYKKSYEGDVKCDIIKQVKKDKIVNIYIPCMNKDDNYRLCDYINAIKNNMKLNFVNKIILLKTEEIDISYIPNCILENDIIEIYEIVDYSFQTVITYTNTYGNDIINCILNQDVYLTNNSNYQNIINSLLTKEFNIYSLSRIETDGTNYWENSKLKNVCYSIAQDVWIFKGEIDVDELDEEIIVGNLWNDLIFNNYLNESGYELINCGRTLPVLHLDTYSRNNKFHIDPIRVKNDDIDTDEYEKYLLADKTSIKDKSIDDIIKQLQLDTDKIYEIKNYILNKYIRI